MIPVQLTFAGLYSYQESVTIDFEPLLKGGLFGIFGPVGSGKSTILEAIMFVLFDRSTRLNKAGDDRYYNMMNLQSSELFIDFIFKAGPNNKNKYRFYFRAQRSRKDFYKVEVKDRSYYQWHKNEWTPIGDSQVLGMTYENFMQTVIIPQGKFREFIDQKPAARTQMLKELFQLHQFDLAPQAFGLLHQVKEKLTFLDGQLSQYQDLNKDLLKTLKQKVKDQNQAITAKSKALKALVQELAAWDKLESDYTQHQLASEQLNLLQAEQDFYQHKSHQVKRFELAKSQFESKIQLQLSFLKQLKENQSLLQSSTDQLKSKTEELIEVESQISHAEKILENQEMWQNQLHDLALLAQNVSRVEERHHRHQKLTEAQAELDGLKQESEGLKKTQLEEEQLVERLSSVETDFADVQTLQHWWNHTQTLNLQLTEFQASWDQIRTELEKSQELKSTLSKEQSDQQTIESALEQAELQLQQLRSQQWWQQHAEGLEEGKPCPLCGSEHHPQVAQTSDLADQLQVAEESKKHLVNEQSLHRERAHKIELLDHNLKAQSTEAAKLQKQIDDLTEQLYQHQSALPERLHQQKVPKDLDQRLKQLQDQMTQLQESRRQVQTRQKRILDLQEQILIKSQTTQQLALRVEEIKGAIDQNHSLLKVLDSNQYQSYTQDQFQATIEKIEQQLKDALQNEQGLKAKQQTVSIEITQHRTRVTWLEQQIQDITDKSQSLEQELIRHCKKQNFKSLSEVNEILALNLNPQQEIKEITLYQERLAQTKESVEQLAKNLKGKQYEIEPHQQVRSNHQALQDELTVLKDEHAGLKHHLLQKEQDFSKKESYLADHQGLSVRKDQIQEVSNLLRGNGFINFISSVYLQNLCKMANARFTQLSGNRLSLELNQQNDFMVRDYLNEGKLRLLKTLSGGQIFQASLCLALALAENVKSMNQSDQSFFFLDEGFGSLDKSSIQVVFETLKTLQKENRVVGIISHVEELQEEIDVFLTVKQVGEAGSSIEASWEQSQ